MGNRVVILLIMLFFAAFFSAAEDEEQPTEIQTEPETQEEQHVVRTLEVLTQHEPAIPIAGSEWTLTLLVSHDRPNEVSVLAPSFSGDFILQQVITGPRFRTNDDDEDPSFSAIPEPIVAGRRTWRVVEFERWTAIEYRFLMNSPGAVYFDSFTVVTPRGRVRTDPFRIVVQRSSGTVITAARRFQLNWSAVPSSLRTGESAEFILLARNWNDSLPDSTRLMPPAPHGHILESIPLSDNEKEAGAVLKLRALPVNPLPFILETHRVVHNNTEFVLPALRIPVSRAEVNPVEDIPDDLPDPELHRHPLPFPSAETAAAVNSRLYQKYKTEFETMYRTAQDHWETNNYADALAALRQHERDHPARELFASMRREAEQTLGFDGTHNEPGKNFFKRLLWFFRGRPRFAVLKETDFRSIPDLAGEVIGSFSEGQPVEIPPTNRTRRNRQETWLRVITNDSSGISGWVPAEKIIFY